MQYNKIDYSVRNDIVTARAGTTEIDVLPLTLRGIRSLMIGELSLVCTGPAADG